MQTALETARLRFPLRLGVRPLESRLLRRNQECHEDMLLLSRLFARLFAYQCPRLPMISILFLSTVLVAAYIILESTAISSVDTTPTTEWPATSWKRENLPTDSTPYMLTLFVSTHCEAGPVVRRYRCMRP